MLDADDAEEGARCLDRTGHQVEFILDQPERDAADDHDRRDLFPELEQTIAMDAVGGQPEGGQDAAERPAGRDHQVKARQVTRCGVAAHEFAMTDHRAGEERDHVDADLLIEFEAVEIMDGVSEACVRHREQHHEDAAVVPALVVERDDERDELDGQRSPTPAGTVAGGCFSSTCAASALRMKNAQSVHTSTKTPKPADQSRTWKKSMQAVQTPGPPPYHGRICRAMSG